MNRLDLLRSFLSTGSDLRGWNLRESHLCEGQKVPAHSVEPQVISVSSHVLIWLKPIQPIHLFYSSIVFFWSIAAAQESWQFSADARLLLLRIRAWLVIFVAWISDATHTHTDPLVADRCHRCLSIDEQFEVLLGITCLESSFEWFCPLPVGEIGNLWQQPWKKDLFSSKQLRADMDSEC